MNETLTRTFDAELTASGDGRTIEARIVPYNTPTWVADPPDYHRYQEMFMPGAFDRQVNASNRVPIWLNFEHEQGIRGLIGYGTGLEDRPDALYGTFRVDDNTDGDKALDYVNRGLLGGVSMEFVDKAKPRRVNGIVERLRAHLDKVSLCRAPAYPDAQVIAVRQQVTGHRRRPRAPVFDATLADRLNRLQIAVPATLLVVERMDVEDLSTVAEMIQLATEYIDDQDEQDDQANIPVMQQVLELLGSLAAVELTEPEPDEPEDDE